MQNIYKLASITNNIYVCVHDETTFMSGIHDARFLCLVSMMQYFTNVDCPQTLGYFISKQMAS